jgi:hypothetical protein
MNPIPDQAYATPPTPPVNRIMVIVGGVIVAGMIAYALFYVINTAGLAQREAVAVVVEKEFREAGTTYTAQRIGKGMQTMAQRVPEMYILHLDVNGKRTACAVDRETYEGLRPGDEVDIVYEKHRITGGLQVLDLRPGGR